MNRYRRSAAQKTGAEPTVLNTDDSIYFVSNNEGSPKKPNIISRKSNVPRRVPAPASNSSPPAPLQPSQERVVFIQQHQHAQSPQLETSIQSSHQQLVLPPTAADQMEGVQNGQSYKSQVYYLLEDGTLAVVDNSSLLPPTPDEPTNILVHQSQLRAQNLYHGQLMQLDQSQQQHRLILPQLHPQQNFVVQHPAQMQQIPVRVQQQVPLLRQRVMLKSKPQHQHDCNLKQELERQKQKQLAAVVKLKLESDEQQRLQQQQQVREQIEFEERQRLHQEHMRAVIELEQQQLREEEAAENDRQMQLNMEFQDQEHQKEFYNERMVDPNAQLDSVNGQEINEEQEVHHLEDKQVAPDVETLPSQSILEEKPIEDVGSQASQEPEEECQQDQYVILQMGNKTLLLPVATFQEYCEAQQSNDAEKTANFLAMVEQALGEANDSTESPTENPETYFPVQDSSLNISNGFDSAQADSTILQSNDALVDFSSASPSPVSIPSSVISIKNEAQEYGANDDQQNLDDHRSGDFNSTSVPENDANMVFLQAEGGAESSLVLCSVDDDFESHVINGGHSDEAECDYEQPPTKRLKEDEEEVSKMTKSNSPVAAQIKSQTEASTNKDNIKIFRCGTCTKEFLSQDLCMQHIFDVHKADPLKTHCNVRRTRETRYMCHPCARTFGSLVDFQQHNLQTHLSDTNRDPVKSSGDSERTEEGTTEQRVSTLSSSPVAPTSFQSPSKTTVTMKTASGLTPATLIDSSPNLKSETDCSQSSKITEILGYPRSLDCSKCSKTLANLYYFLLHGLVHMSESSIDNNYWLCQICRETFCSKPELTSHFLIHYQMSLGASSNSNSHSSTQGNGTQLSDDVKSCPNSGDHPTSSIPPENIQETVKSVESHVSPTSAIESSKVDSIQNPERVSDEIPVVKLEETEVLEAGNTFVSSEDAGVEFESINATCDSSWKTEQDSQNNITAISKEHDDSSSELADIVQSPCQRVPSEQMGEHISNEEPCYGNEKTISVAERDDVFLEDFSSSVPSPKDINGSNKERDVDMNHGDLDEYNENDKHDEKSELIEPTFPGDTKIVLMVKEELQSSLNDEEGSTVLEGSISEKKLKIEPLDDHDNDCESNTGDFLGVPKTEAVVVKRKRKSEKKFETFLNFLPLPKRRTRLSAREVLAEDIEGEAEKVTSNGLVDSLVVSKSGIDKPGSTILRSMRGVGTRRGSKTNIPVIPHDDDLVDNSEDSNVKHADDINNVAVKIEKEDEPVGDESMKRKPGRPKKKEVKADLEATKILGGRIRRSLNKNLHPNNERNTRLNRILKEGLRLVNGNKTATTISKPPSKTQQDRNANSLPVKKVFKTRSSRNKLNVSSDEMKKSPVTETVPPPPPPLSAPPPIKISKICKASKLLNAVEPKIAQVSVAAAPAGEKSNEKKIKSGRKTKTVSRNFAGDEPEFEAGPSKVVRNGSSSSSSTLARRKDRGSLKGMQTEDLTNPLSRTAVQESFMNIYKKMKESTN